jgi:hypothetical protein
MKLDQKGPLNVVNSELHCGLNCRLCPCITFGNFGGLWAADSDSGSGGEANKVQRQAVQGSYPIRRYRALIITTVLFTSASERHLHFFLMLGVKTGTWLQNVPRPRERRNLRPSCCVCVMMIRNLTSPPPVVPHTHTHKHTRPGGQTSCV